MAILGTYIDAGSACLSPGVGNTCFAHSLPSRPDFAGYTGMTAAAAHPNLVSRLNTAVIWRNENTVGQNGEHLLLFAHSSIR